MTCYAALLRGINVGGNNIIKMADLKESFEAMGFEDEKIRLYTAASPFSVLQFGSIKLDMEDFHYMGAFSGQTLRA